MQKSKKTSIMLYCFIFVVMCVCLIMCTANTVYAYEENDTALSVSPEIDQDTGELILTASGGGDNAGYQYWVKQKVNMHSVEDVHQDGLYSVWTNISDGFIEGAATYGGADVDGVYYVIVRSNGGGKITQTYSTIKKSELMPVLGGITIDGNAVSEFNYLEAGKFVTIEAESEFSLTDTSGTYFSESGSLSYSPLQGTYTLYISADGSGEGQFINIKGYKSFLNYTFIDKVEIDSPNAMGENAAKGNTSTWKITTGQEGQGSNVFARIKIGGTIITPVTLNADYSFIMPFGLGYGIYTYTVELVNNNGLTEDYFTGYYNYARNEVLPQMTNSSVSLDSSKDGRTQYTITAGNVTGISGVVTYDFLKYDYNGEYIVQSGTKNQLTINVKNGKYMFEVRARGADSGSFEIRNYVNIGIPLSSSDAVEIKNLNGDILDTEEDVIETGVPYRVSVPGEDLALLYKFIVSGYGQWTVEEYYSPNNSFVWIPAKAGGFRIEARVLYEGSYSWQDVFARASYNVIYRLPIEVHTDSAEIESFNSSKGMLNVSSSGSTLTYMPQNVTDTLGNSVKGSAKMIVNGQYTKFNVKPRLSSYSDYSKVIFKLYIDLPSSVPFKTLFLGDGGSRARVAVGQWTDIVIDAAKFFSDSTKTITGSGANGQHFLFWFYNDGSDGEKNHPDGFTAYVSEIKAIKTQQTASDAQLIDFSRDNAVAHFDADRYNSTAFHTQKTITDVKGISVTNAVGVKIYNPNNWQWLNFDAGRTYTDMAADGYTHIVMRIYFDSSLAAKNVTDFYIAANKQISLAAKTWHYIQVPISRFVNGGLQKALQFPNYPDIEQSFTVYIGEASLRKAANADEIESFDTALGLSSAYTAVKTAWNGAILDYQSQEISSITGSLKMSVTSTNPYLYIRPRHQKEAYSGYASITFKVYIEPSSVPNGKAVLVAAGGGWNKYETLTAGVWTTVTVDIVEFFNASQNPANSKFYKLFEFKNAEADKTTYPNATNNASIIAYISDIKAV